MNRYIFLLIAIIITSNTIAQTIEISKKGVVTVNGKEQFIIDGKQGMINTQFSITNMEGEELIGADATQGEPNLSIVFTGRNEIASYPLTVGTKKVLAKEIAKMKVIQNGELNEMGLKRFLAKYGVGAFGGAQNVVVVTNGYEIADRNMTMPIFVMNGEVKQDNTLVGTYNTQSMMVNNMPGKSFKFYSPATHTLIASVNMENFDKEIIITTYKNNEGYYIELANTYTDMDIAKAVAQFLIDNGFM